MNSWTRDVMVDLETVGTRAGCGILSIGACTLDGRDKFYITVDVNTCYTVGLISDPDTIDWWDRQSAEARTEAFSGTAHIAYALDNFAAWYRGVSGGGIWANGADFDLPILAAAYNAIGSPVPWKYYNTRCYRTLRALYTETSAEPFSGVRHNALADAINQSAHAAQIFRYRDSGGK